MKFNVILFVFFAFLAQGISQKTLSEGMVKMELTDIQADDPQMAMQLEMMKGTTVSISFNKEKYVTDMNMMGGMVVTKSYVVEAEKKLNLFMDMMGQKFWIESDLEETVTPEQKEMAEKSKITYDENDKKEILGYPCYKMMIHNPDMEMEVTGYVTEAIKTKANVIRGFETLEYKGLPLEFTAQNSAFSMTMTATKLDDKVDSSVFNFDSPGYKKMTMKEFQDSFGGMGF